MSEQQLLAQAVEALAGQTIVALTGAGISTDSGIPDYRGAGAPVRQPMTIQRFMAAEENRKRYWAGSHAGWRFFATTKPNAAHQALSQLQQQGQLGTILTQNVDLLHEAAGSDSVVHLHGRLDQVRCLECDTLFRRGEIAKLLAEQNPSLDEAVGRLKPDGDVELDDWSSFVVPKCPVCGGLLKPDVIFFGEFMRPNITAESLAAVDEAEALLVAGSSLAVNSGLRMVNRAAQRGIPIVIVNRGETKGDRLATVKIDAGVSEILPLLAERL